jgi:hypothetical protein
MAPKDMARLKPGREPWTGPGFDANNQRNIAFVFLGGGIGPLTASTDLRKLTAQLAQVASDYTANAINYQILNHGTQIRGSISAHGGRHFAKGRQPTKSVACNMRS